MSLRFRFLDSQAQFKLSYLFALCLLHHIIFEADAVEESTKLNLKYIFTRLIKEYFAFDIFSCYSNWMKREFRNAHSNIM